MCVMAHLNPNGQKIGKSPAHLAKLTSHIICGVHVAQVPPIGGLSRPLEHSFQGKLLVTTPFVNTSA